MSIASASSTPLGNTSNFTHLIWYLITAPPFIIPTKPSYPEIQAILGEKAILPCSDFQNTSKHEISLILWYKEKAKVPFFTVDARRSKLRYFSSPVDVGRINLNFSVLPLQLHIDPVNSMDEGIYRCRIEFKKFPTEDYLVRLHVVIPPKKVKILDELGNDLFGLVGPYNEGSNITFHCLSTGGSPLPTLSWWMDTILLSSNSSISLPKTVMNTLKITQLSREYLLQKYTCISSNTNLTIPLSVSITIDMNLKPLKAMIITSKSPLYADRKIKIQCEAIGYRPNVTLVWSRDGKFEFGDFESSRDIARSSFWMKPSPKENGANLSCIAYNPQIPDHMVDDHWVLSIYYIPKTTISFGHKLNPEMVIEGLDVYFDCHIDSNPMAEDIKWFFGRQQLQSNSSAGVVISNRSLALQKVKRSQTGRYQCAAVNTVGEGWSEPLFFSVKYIPECSHSLIKVSAVHPGKMMVISCDVYSHPESNIFSWSWTSKGETIELPYVTASFFNYSSNMGYGLLRCWATNAIGKQLKPCEISLIRKDNRNVLKSCNVFDVSESSFLVSCDNVTKEEGITDFHLEVHDSSTEKLLVNKSAKDNPQFFVEGIRNASKISLILYASSHKGRTEAINLLRNSRMMIKPSNASTNLIKNKSPALEKDTDFSLLLSTLLCVFIILILMAIFLTILMKKIYTSQSKRSESCRRNRNCTLRRDAASVIQDSPDIIPLRAKDVRGRYLHNLTSLMSPRDELRYVNCFELVE